MDRARWCHLMLRVLGVLFIGLAVPSAIPATLQLVQTLAQSHSNGWQLGIEQMFWLIAWITGTYFQLGFGWYLLFRGQAVARWCLKGVDSCCTVCGYDLAGSTNDKCPECGAERSVEQS